MIVHPYINLSSDEPFWISRKDFAKHFDQHDFTAHRDVESVEPAYRQDWFETIEGKLTFELPVVTYVGDKTQFIIGRHRTAVLLKYMDEIPIAFATARLKPDQLRLWEAIPKRPLILSQELILPDLLYLL